jgi:hypothetical protein
MKNIGFSSVARCVRSTSGQGTPGNWPPATGNGVEWAGPTEGEQKPYGEEVWRLLDPGGSGTCLTLHTLKWALKLEEIEAWQLG